MSTPILVARPIKLIINHPLLPTPIVYIISSLDESFSSLALSIIKTEFYEHYKLLPLLASLYPNKLTTYQLLFGSNRGIIVKPSWGEDAEDGCIDINVALVLRDATETYSPHSTIMSVAALESTKEPPTLTLDVVCTPVSKFGDPPLPRQDDKTTLMKLALSPEGRGYSINQISQYNPDDEALPKRWVYPVDDEESEGDEKMIEGGNKSSGKSEEVEESDSEDEATKPKSKKKTKSGSDSEDDEAANPKEVEEPKSKKKVKSGKAEQRAILEEGTEADAAKSSEGDKSAKKKAKKRGSSEDRVNIMKKATELAKDKSAKKAKSGSSQDREALLKEAAELAKSEAASPKKASSQDQVNITQDAAAVTQAEATEKYLHFFREGASGKGSGDEAKSKKKGKKGGTEDGGDAKAKKNKAKEDDKKKDTKKPSASTTPQSPKIAGALVSNIELSPSKKQPSINEASVAGPAADEKDTKGSGPAFSKKRSKNPTFLSEKDAHVATEQIRGGLPEGWVKRKFTRADGNHVDWKFYTPEHNICLRSKPECQKLFAMLEQAGGDEILAWHLAFDDKGAKSKPTDKPEKESKKKRRKKGADNDDVKVEDADGGSAKASAPPKKKAKAKSKEKDPDKPKRPSTSFILYSMSVRDDVVAKYSDLPPKEITSKIGEMWNALDDDEKKPFVNLYNENLSEYKVKMKAFEAGKENESAGVSTEEHTDSPPKKAKVSTEEKSSSKIKKASKFKSE